MNISPQKKKGFRGARGKKKVEILPSEQYLKLASQDQPIGIGSAILEKIKETDFSDDLLRKLEPE